MNKLAGQTCLVKRVNLEGKETVSRAEIISVGRKWIKVSFVKTGETGLVTPDQVFGLRLVVVTPTSVATDTGWESTERSHEEEVKKALKFLDFTPWCFRAADGGCADGGDTIYQNTVLVQV